MGDEETVLRGKSLRNDWCPSFGIENLFVATTFVSLWAAFLGYGGYPITIESHWLVIAKRVWMAILLASIVGLPVVAVSALFGRTKKALLLWLVLTLILVPLIRWS
jgi:hypothetical protein